MSANTRTTQSSVPYSPLQSEARVNGIPQGQPPAPMPNGIHVWVDNVCIRYWPKAKVLNACVSGGMNGRMSFNYLGVTQKEADLILKSATPAMEIARVIEPKRKPTVSLCARCPAQNSLPYRKSTKRPLTVIGAQKPAGNPPVGHPPTMHGFKERST